MLKKLIVAFDGSDKARKAFGLAMKIAACFGSEVTVLSVARPPEPADSVETAAVLENASLIYEKYFEELRIEAATNGIAPHFVIRVGHPADQIIRLANELDADMILMGHRGKTVIEQWLLGSVSKRVLSYARCSVTIVR